MYVTVVIPVGFEPTYAIYRGSTIELLSDRRGLLLEAKKPLERTPHFFEPEVGECVNASGQLVLKVGFEPTKLRV